MSSPPAALKQRAGRFTIQSLRQLVWRMLVEQHLRWATVVYEGSAGHSSIVGIHLPPGADGASEEEALDRPCEEGGQRLREILSALALMLLDRLIPGWTAGNGGLGSLRFKRAAADLRCQLWYAPWDASPVHLDLAIE
ncbi:MAG TPA: hypothetical protein VF265_03925 [Nevskiaceae bacterium]